MTVVLKHNVLNSVLDNKNTSNFLLRVSKNKLCFKKRDISKVLQKDINALQKIIDEEKSGINFIQGVIKFVLVKLSDNQSVLVFYVHHAVIDGQSMYLLKKDIIENYVSILENQYTTPKTTPNFIDYANLVNSTFAGKALSFWQNMLQNVEPTRFSYKLTNNISDQEHFSFISKSYNLPKNTLEFLRQNSITLSTAINGLVGLLISKHMMESSKVVWGNILSMRPNEIENVSKIVGPCITTVPMYFNFSKTIKLIDYLKEISIKVASALEHGNVSLGEICSHLEKSSLFNFLFVYQNYMKEDKQISSQFGSFTGEISSHFDCTYVCEVNDDQLKISSKFNQKLFDKTAINSFTDKLFKMLEGLVNKQSKFVQEINILEKWEREIIQGYNATDVQYDDQTSLYNIVEKQIKENVNNIAVLDSDGKNYKYSKLKQEVDRIFSALYNKSDSKYVGVLLPRSFKQISAILAVLRSDSCLVGLETTFPKAKLAEICTSSNIDCIITDNHYYNLVKDTNIKIINLDEISTLSKILDIQIDKKLKQEYFVAYTSGSTGKPKMVLTDEKSNLNRLLWLKNNHPMKKDDRSAYKTKLSFAPSIREILEPLIQGATICVLSDEELSDSDRLLNRIKNNKLSRIFFTPSHLINLLNFENSIQYLSSIKHLEISGESFDNAMLAKIQSMLPNTKIYNRYGATEIASVIYTDLSKFHSNNNRLIAGKPIYNSKAFVVNNNLDPLPVGCIGEIVLGGDSCANGYLGQDSSDAFIQNTNLCKNTKFFKTGDLGLLTENNNLIVLGRKNKICKIRGFRINLLEIENEINKLVFIKNSAVIHSKENNTIIAFVVPKEVSSDKLHIREILAVELEKNLPYYSLPSDIIVLEEMPKTNSGKIDYVGLSKLTKCDKTLSVFKPKTENETNIINILEEIIDYRPTMADTNFFRLGLTSLTTQLFVHKLSSVYKFNIPVSVVYSNPNIQSLAKKLGEQQEQTNNTSYITFNKGKRGQIFAFPPAGGSPFNYQELSSSLGKQLIAFNKLKKSGDTQNIKTIAKEYVKQIQNNKFNNQFYLMGWSLGGTVAYEVACQLERQGITPLGVFLIDPGFNLSSKGMNNNYENNNESKLLEIMKRNLSNVDDNNSDIIKAMLNNLYSDSKKINEYKPNKYKGDVVVIKPTDIASDERNYGLKSNGLDRYVTGITTSYQVPGNHMTMITNYSHEIAKIFNNHYYAK